MEPMRMEAGAQQVVPPNPLAVLQGAPGTHSDVALRVVQFVSAIFAVVAMVSAKDFYTVSAFIFLVAASSLQALWSFSVAVLDVVVMVSHYPLQNHWATSKFIFGDLITGTLTFCAAFASGGVVMYIRYDIERCAREHCTNFENAMTRAFISFAAIVPSLVVNYVGR